MNEAAVGEDQETESGGGSLPKLDEHPSNVGESESGKKDGQTPIIGTYVEEDVSLEPPVTMVPNYILAKGFLMKASNYDTVNCYDHMLSLVRQLLLERPKEGLTMLEDMSYRLKYQRINDKRGYFGMNTPHRVNLKILLLRYEYLKQHKTLINAVRSDLFDKILSQKSNEDEEEEEEEETKEDERLNDEELDEGDEFGKSRFVPSGQQFPGVEVEPPLLDLIHYVDNFDIAISRQDLLDIYITLDFFTKTKPFKTVRFWGKLMGKDKDYYIIETSFPDGKVEAYTKIEDSDEESVADEPEEYQDESDIEEVKEEATKEILDEEEEIEKPGLDEEAIMMEDEEKAILDEDNPLEEEKTSEEEEGEDEDTKIEDEGKGEGIDADEEMVMEEVEKEQIGEKGVVEDLSPYAILPIEREFNGEGVNKYTYYASNNKGMKWKRLPDLSPEQVSSARSVYLFLTGHYTTDIKSYPNFDWNETYLLRAQIARISSGTSISPIGYYSVGDFNKTPEDNFDEMDEEDIGMNAGPNSKIQSVTLQSDFEFPSMEDLLHMNFWAHDRSYILSQGRCTWTDYEEPKPKVASSIIPSIHSEVPENRPHLLNPISDDVCNDESKVWEITNSSRMFKKFSFVVLKNWNWPGAYTFCNGKQHSNFYLGFGVKNVSTHIPSLHEMPYRELDGRMPLPDPTLKEEMRAIKRKEARLTKAWDEEVNRGEDDEEPPEEDAPAE